MALTFWQEVKAYLENIFTKIKPFFEPLLKEFESSIGPAVLAAAETEAANLGALGLNAISTDQFKTATDNILNDLKKQGITVAVSIATTALSGALHSAAASAAPAAPAASSTGA